MKENAKRFLADLDGAYRFRGENDWDSYCLECHVPESFAWCRGFVPTKKIEELLRKHEISLETFLDVWAKVAGLSPGDSYLERWKRGHLPSGCTERNTIVKVLENLDEDAFSQSAK